VKGRDENWKEVRIKGTELLAQASSMNRHLNGTLYVDHLEKPELLKKLEPEGAEA